MPVLSAFGRVGLEIQSHSWVHGEFEPSVGDMTFCQKGRKGRGDEGGKRETGVH